MAARYPSYGVHMRDRGEERDARVDRDQRAYRDLRVTPRGDRRGQNGREHERGRTSRDTRNGRHPEARRSPGNRHRRSRSRDHRQQGRSRRRVPSRSRSVAQRTRVEVPRRAVTVDTREEDDVDFTMNTAELCELLEPEVDSLLPVATAAEVGLSDTRTVEAKEQVSAVTLLPVATAAEVGLLDTRRVEAIEQEPAGTGEEDYGDTRRVKSTVAGKMCPVCLKRFGKVYRHVLAEHLPWYFQPEVACWTCKKAMKTAAKLEDHTKRGCGETRWSLEVWVASMIALLEALAKMLGVEADAVHHGAPLLQHSVSPVREALLLFVEEALGRSVDRVELAPVNCPAGILNVAVIGPMLATLSPDDKAALRDWQLVDKHGLSPLSAGIVDGHCHVNQLGRKDKAWFCEPVEMVEGGPVRLEKVIDNCVFPGEWMLRPQDGRTSFRVYQSIGVHPRVAAGEVPWESLEGLIQQPECKAVGECGLDATALGSAQMEVQREVLARQMRLAKKVGKPLILHVRGSEEMPTEKLFEEVLALMIREDMDRQQKVYLHTFTGSHSTMMRWRTKFPRLMLGISWKSCTSGGFAMLGRRTACEMLALETDAPYLSPRAGRHNRPQWMVRQAQELAKLRRLPVRVMLKRCGLNVTRFFELE